MLERRNDAFWRSDVKTEQKTLTNIRAAWLTLTDTLWPSTELVVRNHRIDQGAPKSGPQSVVKRPAALVGKYDAMSSILTT